MRPMDVMDKVDGTRVGSRITDCVPPLAFLGMAGRRVLGCGGL